MLSAPALAGRKILRTEMARPPTLRFGATAFAHPCVASEGWWALRDSNPRPTRCKRDALTTAPSARSPLNLGVEARVDNGEGLGREKAKGRSQKPVARSQEPGDVRACARVLTVNTLQQSGAKTTVFTANH